MLTLKRHREYEPENPAPLSRCKTIISLVVPITGCAKISKRGCEWESVQTRKRLKPIKPMSPHILYMRRIFRLVNSQGCANLKDPITGKLLVNIPLYPLESNCGELLCFDLYNLYFWLSRFWKFSRKFQIQFGSQKLWFCFDIDDIEQKYRMYASLQWERKRKLL